MESRIGAGGMAMVFRARDESLGRTVALKALAPGVADDVAFRERFIRESRAAAVVDHPHIIPVYGAGEFEGVLYIAMRYVAGGDLRALLGHVEQCLHRRRCRPAASPGRRTGRPRLGRHARADTAVSPVGAPVSPAGTGLRAGPGIPAAS